MAATQYILALCDLPTNAIPAYTSGVTPHVHTGLGQVSTNGHYFSFFVFLESAPSPPLGRAPIKGRAPVRERRRPIDIEGDAAKFPTWFLRKLLLYALKPAPRLYTVKVFEAGDFLYSCALQDGP
jgi:hypothetical protein